MAAASRRCLSSSCSRAIACCFLLGLSSPDLDLRNSKPREERRGGCALEAISGIAANLSEGGEWLALGVRGLDEDTMLTGYGGVSKVAGIVR